MTLFDRLYTYQLDFWFVYFHVSFFLSWKVIGDTLKENWNNLMLNNKVIMSKDYNLMKQ